MSGSRRPGTPPSTLHPSRKFQGCSVEERAVYQGSAVSQKKKRKKQVARFSRLIGAGRYSCCLRIICSFFFFFSVTRSPVRLPLQHPSSEPQS